MVMPISSASHLSNLSPISRATNIGPSESENVAEVAQDEAEQSSGVIKNLMDGHFKGVADVRLRIVHADKIAAAQVAADQARAAAARNELHANLVATVETFLSDYDASASADIDAATAASAAFQSALESDGTDLVEAISELEQALRRSLSDPMEAPSDSDPATEVASSEEVSEPTEPDAFAELAAALRQMIETSESSASEMSLLPPLSPAPGHGHAYAKFLSMYDSLQAAPSSEDPGTPLLDLAG